MSAVPASCIQLTHSLFFAHGKAAAYTNCSGYIQQERIIGQSEAVRALARAMWRARTGLKDPRRPIAAMLFAGGTGVGKTETTKVMRKPDAAASCVLKGQMSGTQSPSAAHLHCVQ